MNKTLSIDPPINNTLFYKRASLPTNDLANMSTPKVQVFPAIENINSILDKRRPSTSTKTDSPSFTSDSASYTSVKTFSSSSFKRSNEGITSSPLMSVIPPKNYHAHPTSAHASLRNSPESFKPQYQSTITHREAANLEAYRTQKSSPDTSIQAKRGYQPFVSPQRKSLTGLSVGSSLGIKSPSIPSPELKSQKWKDDLDILDESDVVTSEGAGENVSRISNMTRIHNFNARFHENRHRANSIKRKSTMEYSKNTLLKENILNHILSFLDCPAIVNFSKTFSEFRNDDKYKSIFKKKLFKRLLRGINELEQYAFWDAFMNFKELKKNYPTSFTQNFVRKCEYVKDIVKDLDRTLPEYEKYTTEAGKNALLKVLVAVSNSIKDVGYIQGLNSIVGVFLFYLKEEQSFWATLFMMEKLKVKDLLKEDFQTIYVLNYQFEVFFENYLPKLNDHLNFQAITLEHVTTPWFITLYSYFLALPHVVKLWNLFFIKGPAFLIQFGIGVFAYFERSLMSIDPDEVPNYLKSALRDVENYDNRIFEKAMEFKIPKRLMRELAEQYDKGKPKPKFFRDHDNKLQWDGIQTTLNTETSILRYSSEDMRRSSNLLYNSKFSISPEKPKTSSNTLKPSTKQEESSKIGNIFSAISFDISGTLKNIFKKKNSEPAAPTTNLDDTMLSTTQQVAPIKLPDFSVLGGAGESSPIKAHSQSGAASPQKDDSKMNIVLKGIEDEEPDDTVFFVEQSPENKKIGECGGYQNFYNNNYSYFDQDVNISELRCETEALNEANDKSLSHSKTFEEVKKIQSQNNIRMNHLLRTRSVSPTCSLRGRLPSTDRPKEMPKPTQSLRGYDISSLVNETNMNYRPRYVSNLASREPETLYKMNEIKLLDESKYRTTPIHYTVYNHPTTYTTHQNYSNTSTNTNLTHTSGLDKYNSFSYTNTQSNTYFNNTKSTTTTTNTYDSRYIYKPTYH